MFPSYLPFLLIGVCLDAVFIVMEYRENWWPAVILKGLASAMFVTVGFLCRALSGDSGAFGLLVVLGLVLGAVGDVLLNLRNALPKYNGKLFPAGIAAFLLGHLLYIAALCVRNVRALLIAVPLGAVLCAIILPLTLRAIDAPAKLKTFGLIYLGTVIVMFAAAASLCLRTPDTTGVLFFTGALLFLVSDMLLAFNLFGRKKRRWYRGANLALYYIGQLLIALSLLTA